MSVDADDLREALFVFCLVSSSLESPPQAAVQPSPESTEPDPDWFDQSQTWKAPEIHLDDGRILVLEYT